MPVDEFLFLLFALIISVLLLVGGIRVMWQKIFHPNSISLIQASKPSVTREPNPVMLAGYFGRQIGLRVFIGYLIVAIIGFLIFLLSGFPKVGGSLQDLAAYFGAWIVFTFIIFTGVGFLLIVIASLLTALAAMAIWRTRSWFANSPADWLLAVWGVVVCLGIAIPLNLYLRLKFSDIAYIFLVGIPSLIYIVTGGWVGYKLPKFMQQIYPTQSG